MPISPCFDRFSRSQHFLHHISCCARADVRLHGAAATGRVDPTRASLDGGCRADAVLRLIGLLPKSEASFFFFFRFCFGERKSEALHAPRMSSSSSRRTRQRAMAKRPCARRDTCVPWARPGALASEAAGQTHRQAAPDRLLRSRPWFQSSQKHKFLPPTQMQRTGIWAIRKEKKHCGDDIT